jgi:hypothetical protein
MTNQDVMNKLEEYFNTQDPKKVARLAASMSIDLNRFLNFDELDKNEQDNLVFRVIAMVNQTKDMMNGKPFSTLDIVNVTHDVSES